MFSAGGRDCLSFLLLFWVQSMQAKQQSLLKRVDALDNECEELQGQLGEREERQIDLHNQLQQMSEEKEQVQAQLAEQQVYWSSLVAKYFTTKTFKASSSCCDASFQQDLCLELQKEKRTLETDIGELKDSVSELKEYVQALKERERLLVAFPELCPLAHPQSRQLLKIKDIIVLYESLADITFSFLHYMEK